MCDAFAVFSVLLRMLVHAAGACAVFSVFIRMLVGVSPPPVPM